MSCPECNSTGRYVREWFSRTCNHCQGRPESPRIEELEIQNQRLKEMLNHLGKLVVENGGPVRAANYYLDQIKATNESRKVSQ